MNATLQGYFASIPVDLTTQDPWTGIFIVPTAGLWRFTFTGLGVGKGYVTLRVDNKRVARSFFDDGAYETISINTLQQLQIGQNVTIDFDSGIDGSYLHDNVSYGPYTHWTGTYMQSGTAVPPECEYPGQGCNSI